jgi:restriction endonuclease S subunit
LNRPFDEAKYKRLLNGLEVAELSLYEVLDQNEVLRLDSDYYQKEFLENESLLKKRTWSYLKDLVVSIKSFGAYSLCSEIEYLDEGIPFLRGQNIKGGVVDFSDCHHINEAANALLWKSEVMPRMVLLTMSGTVGNTAVAMEDWRYPINSNQDIAKISVLSNLNPYFLCTFLMGKHGSSQMRRLPVGSVQQHTFIWQLEKLLTPIHSIDFQTRIEEIFKAAHQKRDQSKALYAEAENLLLDELGLQDRQPSEEQIAVKSFQESFLHTGRLDAEYYQAKYQTMLSLLGRSGKRIRDVADFAKDRFDPSRVDSFEYIEFGNLSGDGSTENETIFAADAPSRAQWIVQTGDVITSTVRPIRRLSALIENHQRGFVCSSGFAVLRPTNIAPELLLVFLRAPIICEILDLHTTASMYPAISTDDLMAIPIPEFSDQLAAEVTQKISQSRITKQSSKHLLDVAKRGVEMAIEQDEAVAMEWMEAQIKTGKA